MRSGKTGETYAVERGERGAKRDNFFFFTARAVERSIRSFFSPLERLRGQNARAVERSKRVLTGRPERHHWSPTPSLHSSCSAECVFVGLGDRRARAC